VRRAAQPRLSSTGVLLTEADEKSATTPTSGSGFRSSIRIVPGGAHDTWSGFGDTPTSAGTKFHSSFRSMGVKARTRARARARWGLGRREGTAIHERARGAHRGACRADAPLGGGPARAAA
jgi:hypothetical protein